MTIKEFIDKNESNLIIEYNNNNIFFKTNDKNIKKDYYLSFYLNEDLLKEIIKYLENISKKLWKDFNPKETNSISSDYTEYYDRKYDNNGYLFIHNKEILRIEKPCKSCPYVYKFNKRKMESFIYDLKKYYDNYIFKTN